MAEDDDKLKPPPHFEKLKTPPELEKLKPPQFKRLALSPERKAFFEQIGRPGGVAAAIRDAKARQAPPKPKPKPKRRSRPRDVLHSIFRDRHGPGGPPAGVTDYELWKQIKKPLWDKAWRRLYGEESKPSKVPGLKTVAAARRYFP